MNNISHRYVYIKWWLFVLQPAASAAPEETEGEMAEGEGDTGGEGEDNGGEQEAEEE